MRAIRLVWLAFACFAAFLLASCETAAPPSVATPAAGTESALYAAAQAERPGLGTSWGETRGSRVVEVPFRRARPSTPSALARIYYNDLAGVLALAGGASPRRTRPVLPKRISALAWVSLRDESGQILPGLLVDDRWFIIGEAGRRYSISVRNVSAERIEVVLSVDGLDVMDGRPASFAKRGYIIAPQSELKIQGWRRSLDEVAAFRFGSVRDSYANRKYGDTRNVGVIGVAVFHEEGTDLWTSDEVRRRLDANPFPGDGRFATPP